MAMLDETVQLPRTDPTEFWYPAEEDGLNWPLDESGRTLEQTEPEPAADGEPETAEGPEKGADGAESPVPRPDHALGEFNAGDSLPPYRNSGRAGRLVRKLTGTYEDYLDWVPAERARYSALACVMMGTASFSGLAFYLALSEIFGSGRLYYVLFAAGWAVFVLNLDRWLIASSSGTRMWSRAKTVLPRLVIACIIGLTISEPLILLIFQGSIQQTVDKNRGYAISQLVDDYNACNPVPGAVPAPPAPTAANDCAHHTLSISVNPGADAAQIASLQTEIDSLQKSISQDSDKLSALQGTVNNECNGVPVPGVTTGHVGDGPACRQDQAAVVQYEKDHPIAKEQSQLTQDQNQLTAMEQREGTDTTAFKQALKTGIADAERELPKVGSAIGLGDRYAALLSLSTSDAVIGVTSWVLRLFFIVVDCLPVFLKFVGGAAPYDFLVDQKNASSQRIFARRLESEERIAELRLETELHNVQIEEEGKRSQAAVTQRNADIDTELRQQNEVDRLWQIKLAHRKQAQDRAADGLLPDAPDAVV